ncbi:hypothetical protein ACFFX1_34070 [Dactylosporangium sucinum]|nr:hypothetical protein [Dactylosporangium sucinum]
MVLFDPADLILNANDEQLGRFVDLLNTGAADPRFAHIRETLYVLPFAFLERYQAGRRADQLDQAIATSRTLLREDFDSDLTASAQANLASALVLRYELTGEAPDLEEAIATSRASLTGPVAGDERAGRLATLAHLLAKRADHYNSAKDLERAVDLLEESVRVPEASPEKLGQCWSDLAGALRDRYHRSRDMDALVRAVAALRKAVELSPTGSAHHQMNRINLAGALRDYASATRNIGELDAALADAEAMTEELPPTDPRLADYLFTLGTGQLSKLRLVGGADAARVAQATLQDALNRTQPDEPIYASIAMSLAEAFLWDENRSVDALRLLDLITDHSSAPAGGRFDAARLAAELRVSLGDLRPALSSWRKAVDLLPVVAWRGSNYAERQAVLGRHTGTATEAAACAVAVGRSAEAVDMLEIGRGVQWSQLLEARTDLARLRAVRPGLAARLETVGMTLNATHHC